MKAIILLSILMSLNTYANDPLSSMQWGIKNIGQPIFRSTGELTRELVQGTPGEDIGIPNDYVNSDDEVIVAVIDSGVDIFHPDLKENIWLNPKCKSLSEEQRVKEDCHGWNFLDGNADVSDDIGHGTHVAGIIGATENNGIGIKGVASKNVKIMPLKILNSKVKSFVYGKKVITNVIADAIAYAVTNGASVINLSLGWPALIHTQKVRYAIDTAIKRNVSIIVAAGNNNKKLPVYPCSYDEVICVGAMDNKGDIPEFSNFGGKVDIVAPGEGIISTYPRNLESRTLRISGYEVKKGSSQAAPFVSALVALLKSKNKNLTFDEVKYRLYKSSETSKSIKNVKYGKINFDRILKTNISSGMPYFKFKGLTEVEVKENGEFSFELPIRALMSDILNLKFSISLLDDDSNDIIHSQVVNVEKVSTEKNSVVTINGVLKSFKSSSHLKLQVITEERSYEHEIALVRNMLNVDSRTSKKLSFKDSEVLVNSNGRLSTRLRKVVSNKYESLSLDYFTERTSSDPNKTLIKLVKITPENTQDSLLSFDKVGKIISVIKNDFNSDGDEDYMVYSLSVDNKFLVLTYTDSSGGPLYGDHSQWFLEISTFEGLPFFNGEVRFEYLKVPFLNYGNVKVPSFMKEWLMPDEDNTLDPLDRVPDGSAMNRPYYLNPVLKNGRVEISIRTLGSYDFLESVKKEFNISPVNRVFFDHLVEQDGKSKSLEAILISGKEFSKRYFHITYEGLHDYKIEEISFYGLSLDSNRTLLSRHNGKQFSASFALNSRQHLRTVFWDFDGNRETRDFMTDTWGDIIIDIFDYDKNQDRNLVLLESRYFIHAIDNEGSSNKLPINRESSFPGVSFSETFKKINVSVDGRRARGILVDSTLIYGDRIYSMVYDNGKFSSPAYASFSLPKNCKYLDVFEFSDVGHIVTACQDKFMRATLELIPLKK